MSGRTTNADAFHTLVQKAISFTRQRGIPVYPARIEELEKMNKDELFARAHQGITNFAGPIAQLVQSRDMNTLMAMLYTAGIVSAPRVSEEFTPSDNDVVWRMASIAISLLVPEE